MYWLSVEIKPRVFTEIWFSEWSEVYQLLGLVNGEPVQEKPTLADGEEYPDSIETVVDGKVFKARWVDSRISSWEYYKKLEDDNL